jgi:MFS family permease
MSRSQGEHLPDSRYAWTRLLYTLVLMTVGAGGMYVVPVVLPTVQADFGVTRANASLPYSLLMIGVGVGGFLYGRLADRFGIWVVQLMGGVSIGLGYYLAARSTSIDAFTLWHALLIGLFGTACTFAPLMADTSLWFEKRRGIAVAICASGNYLGGTLWPPIVQHFVETSGWRATYTGMAIVTAVTMIAFSFLLRPRPPAIRAATAEEARAAPHDTLRPFGLAPNTAMALLMTAGVACCVAMSMPQVHIVAYCGDLGYGAARGAEMLSLMLGMGIVSRLVSGWICDHIGGLKTLLLGSALQAGALVLFLPFNGLVPLYVISGLFGLCQGGLVPAYAIIIREHFDAREAGWRVGAVIMCTLLGMALGGWMSGKVFDLTGSYKAAFVNGIAWNAVNFTIVFFLLRGAMRASHARLQRA